jgi:hypothetical protein
MGMQDYTISISTIQSLMYGRVCRLHVLALTYWCGTACLYFLWGSKLFHQAVLRSTVTEGRKQLSTCRYMPGGTSIPNVPTFLAHKQHCATCGIGHACCFRGRQAHLQRVIGPLEAPPHRFLPLGKQHPQDLRQRSMPISRRDQHTASGIISCSAITTCAQHSTAQHSTAQPSAGQAASSTLANNLTGRLRCTTSLFQLGQAK